MNYLTKDLAEGKKQADLMRTQKIPKHLKGKKLKKEEL